jgi:hypothetical protein
MNRNRKRGVASHKRYGKQSHKRWSANLPPRRVPDSHTCKDCRFFIPSTGMTPVDWGVCSQSLSPFDGLATVEYFGCEHFERQTDPELYFDTNYAHATHERWVLKYRNDGKPCVYQCGGCRFYIVLDGALITDWGLCDNARSPFDGRAMFEHDCCEQFEDTIHGRNSPDPQAALLRQRRLLAALPDVTPNNDSPFGDYLSPERETVWQRVKTILTGHSPIDGSVIEVSKLGVIVDIGVGFPASLRVIRFKQYGKKRLVYPDDYPGIGRSIHALVYGFVDEVRQIILTQHLR